MIGPILTIVTAITYSAKGLLSKGLLNKYNTFTINGVTRFQSLMLILIALFATGSEFSITLTPQVIIVIISFIVIGGVAINLSLKALKHLPLSTYQTVNNIGIFFTALFSGLLLNEIPSVIDIFCIIAIVMFCFSLTSKHTSIIEIFKEAIGNPGFKYTLSSQLLFAVTAIGMRYWAQIDSPLSIAIVITTFSALSNLTFAFIKKRKKLRLDILFNREFWMLSLITGLALLLNLAAQQYVEAAVFRSILSLQIFFSIILGHLFFHERYNITTYAKFGGVLLLVGLMSLY